MKLTEQCKPLQTIVNKWDDWCSLIKLSLVWNLKQDISVIEAPSFSSCFVLAHLHILFYLLNISGHCRLCYYYRPWHFCCLIVPQDAHHCCLSDVASCVLFLHAYPYNVWSVFDYLPACLAPLDLFVCSCWLPATECKPPQYQVKPSFIISVLPHDPRTVHTCGADCKISFVIISSTDSRRQI